MREEEKKQSSQGSSFKRFFKKRWAFPAIYIASAAIILTAVLWYQNGKITSDQADYDYKATDVPGKKTDEPAVEVNRAMENILMPVKDADSVVVKRNFYDANANNDEQEAALVFYNNSYHQNTGVNIGREDNESFEVVAALSGTVVKAEEDRLMGNVIEIEHGNGIVTRYQSVKDMAVDVGDEVKQGQVLAVAGESNFDEDAGVHVHFEIRKNGVAVNPHSYFQKPLSALQEDESADKANATEDEKKADEEKASDDAAKEDNPEGSDKESDEKSSDEDEDNKADDNVQENKKESSDV